MTYKFIFPRTQDEKYKLMEFVYNNTDSFIMNTFGYLWESRGWWDIQPILVSYDEDKITGLHAFAIKVKTLKTYYIVVDKNYRGQNIGKKLTLEALEEFKNAVDTFFVNSEESSSGVPFYKKMFGTRYTTSINEFGTTDYNFSAPIKDIINENSIYDRIS